MLLLARALKVVDGFRPPRVAHAHCDLPCGVYDPAQARIEAESVLRICEKYQESDDPEFRQRCIHIKEARADFVKHHLWVLWTDYFKPHHLEKHPELHARFWAATKAAGDSKRSTDPSDARKLIEAVDAVADIFWRTEEAADAGLYRPEMTGS